MNRYAQSDFMGFLTLKDESNDNVLDQVTPEEFTRSVSPLLITNESFTSSHDVAVSLNNQAIMQYSETVTTTDGATTYTRDTDYTMSYSAGTITVLSTGSMSDATGYYIDYSHSATGTPSTFCIEYDAANAKYVFRLSDVPDDTYIGSIVYSASPSDLSATVDVIWNKLEFAIEQGGIYYGSMVIIDDEKKRREFKANYEVAMQALIQLDISLMPKNDRIKVVMKKTDY